MSEDRCGYIGPFYGRHAWEPDEQVPDEYGYVEYETCSRPASDPVHQDVESVTLYWEPF